METYNNTQKTLLAQKTIMADNFLTRLVGLLNKSSLDSNECLILKPCREIHTFFMRFNIDVLFLDKDCKVIFMMENMGPSRKSPRIKEAKMVVEMLAGKIAESGTKIGDEIFFREETK